MPSNRPKQLLWPQPVRGNVETAKLLQRGECFADLGGLVERAQAAAAYLDCERGAVAVEGLFVDVGFEAGLGVPVGVADVVAAHTGLQAYLAAHIGCLSALGRRQGRSQPEFCSSIEATG